MKNLLLCFVLLCLNLNLSAQEPSSIIKLGAQWAPSPYGDFKTLGALAQYDYRWPGRWSVAGALGFAGNNHNIRINTRGSSNGAEWDTSYQYNFEEQVVNLDAHIFYSLNDNDSPQNFKIGIGVSGLLAQLRHPELVEVSLGQIDNITYDKRLTPVVMANLVVDYDIGLGDRFVFHVKGILRSSFKDVDSVDVNVTNEIGRSISTYHINTTVALSLGVGYRL